MAAASTASAASSTTTTVTASEKRLLDIRFHSTLHGFQISDDGRRVFIAFLNSGTDTRVLADYIHRETGVLSFNTNDCGRVYAYVGIEDRQKIPVVVNAILRTLTRSILVTDTPSPRSNLKYVCTYTVCPNIVDVDESCAHVEFAQGHMWTTGKETVAYANLPDTIELITRLHPRYHPGSLFSVEESERLFVREFTNPQLFKCSPQAWCKIRATPINLPEIAWIADNWKTEEGRAFVRQLPRWHPEQTPHHLEEVRVIRPGQPCYELAQKHAETETTFDYPSARVGSMKRACIESEVAAESAAKRSRSDSPVESGAVEEGEGEEGEGEEDNVCMVCMDNAPSTMVLPCMHTVLCQACADRVKQTREARTCMRCRCPVTEVLYDERAK